MDRKARRKFSGRAAFPRATHHFNTCMSASDSLQRWAVLAGRSLPHLQKGFGKVAGRGLPDRHQGCGKAAAHSLAWPGWEGQVARLGRLKPEQKLEWSCGCSKNVVSSLTACWLFQQAEEIGGPLSMSNCIQI